MGFITAGPGEPFASALGEFRGKREQGCYTGSAGRISHPSSFPGFLDIRILGLA